MNLLFETTIHVKHSQQKSYFNFWCFKKVLILYLLNHIMSACQSWKIKVSDVNVTTFMTWFTQIDSTILQWGKSFIKSDFDFRKIFMDKTTTDFRPLFHIGIIGMVGILLPKLFWPTVRKNCSSDREKLLKFEAKDWEFAKCLRSLDLFLQTVKGQNNCW